MKRIATIILMAGVTTTAIHAQSDSTSWKQVTLNGSVQSDILVPTGAQADGSNEDFRTNTYIDLNAQSKYVDAGLRLEYLKHPLPGFENDFKGWGVPHFFVKGKMKNAELTLGTFYEQFGSGFVLRTYEERQLGIDNPLLGGRLIFTPYKGVRIKALSGKQRRYWGLTKAWISGVDAELSLNEWIPSLQKSDTYLTLGGSWVNKYESSKYDNIYASSIYKLNLPEYVNAFDIRANLTTRGLNLLAEYAWKTQDPSFDNGWIYRKGNVAMLSASYSKKGMSMLLQAKRSDNFSFRSDRSMNGSSAFINHLPAFAEDHTYELAAFYPYNTFPSGEWAYQAQFGYNFKRKTALGGKYGTNLKLNVSYVNGINKTASTLNTVVNGKPVTLIGYGTNGYTSSFWKWGDGIYYSDVNLKLEKRLTRSTKLNLMYMYQVYNQTVVEGEGGMIHSNIFVAEALNNLGKNTTLRTELQYLQTKDDDGDWMFALVEMSFAPHWMITVSDLYNNGSTKNHYWITSLTYNVGAHRLQLGWGRTVDGYNCSGGVCRYVPETKGFTLSYNYNF